MLLNLLVSIGTVDLMTLYGRPLGPLYPLVVFATAATWLLVKLGLGFAGRSGHRWGFGVHAFLVFKWFQGQKALKDLGVVEITSPFHSLAVVGEIA